jgi:sigma-E factor negative regulatory protein RseB
VLERFQFVDLQIQPLKAEWVAAVPDQSTGPVGNATTVAAAPVGAPGWSPQWLPPGFVLSLPPRHAQEDVLTFSDGLAVMSVFIEAANDPVPAAEGRARQGATVAYTRPLHTQNQSGKDQSFIVTVVGEVPQATAERVANSVDMSAQ